MSCSIESAAFWDLSSLNLDLQPPPLAPDRVLTLPLAVDADSFTLIRPGDELWIRGEAFFVRSVATGLPRVLTVTSRAGETALFFEDVVGGCITERLSMRWVDAA